MKKSILLLFTISLLYACSEFEFPEPEPQLNSEVTADFSNIVFIGGIRFSGVLDGALSSQGYEYAVPNLFLKESGFVDQEAVLAPKIISENGFNIYTNPDLNGTDGAFRLFYPQDDTLFFKRETRLGTSLSYENSGAENLSVFGFPNATLLDITETGLSINPYTTSFFDNSTSILQRARMTNPTFFIMDLGFDHIFDFAKHGATGNPSVNSIDDFDSGDLLSEDMFREKLQYAVDQMISSNPEAKGLLFNIPDIFRYPFFTLMPTSINSHAISKKSIRWDAQPLAISFNQRIFDYYDQNPLVIEDDRRPLLDFDGLDHADRWGLVVEDKKLTDLVYNATPIPKLKQIELSDYVFYQNEQLLWSGYGSLVETPIKEDGYLDLDEAVMIQEKIRAYNAIILDVINNSNGKLAQVNTFQFFEDMFRGYNRLLGNPTEGLNIDGVRLEPLISRDGIFSGDGINMNPVGNVVITNRIIEAINEHFNGNLQKLDPNNVPNTPFGIGN